MLDRLSRSVPNHPWRWIVGVLLVAALFGLQVRRVQIDPRIKSQLPAHMPARLNLEAIEELFGGTDMLMIVLETEDVLNPKTLERVQALSDGLEKIPNIDRVMSLFTLKDIRGEAGEMVVNPAVETIPQTSAEREQLRERLRQNELVYRSVVSEDFRATTIIGLLNQNADDDAVVEAVQQLLDRHPGPERIYLAGIPIVRRAFSRDIRKDLSRFLPYGLVAMLIFLFLSFRRWRGMVLPSAVVVLSIAVAMGMIPIFGWKIYMVTVLLPVILIAVANDYGIHLIAHYQELNRPGRPETPRELAGLLIRRLGVPIAAAALTTMLGLLSLLTHVIVPARQLGVLAALGIGFALVASLTLIPALLAVLPKDRPVFGQEGDTSRRPWLDRLLHRTALGVVRHPRAVVLSLIAVVLFLALGIRRVQVDTDAIRYYPPDHPIPQAAAIVDRYFGGSTPLAIVAEGDVKDPALLQEIVALQEFLESDPRIGDTSSIADMIRMMHRAMNDNDPAAYRIPDSREAVAQYLLLYSMSGDPEDFDRLVDFPYQHALITARLRVHGTREITALLRHLDQYLASRPNHPFTLIGGFTTLYAELANTMVRGQLISLFLSLGMVAAVLALFYRSLRLAAFAVLPLGVAVIVLFGLMGYAGISLNIATTMLSSIMIGVGVDYTIHYLWRYRSERVGGKSPQEAVYTTLTTSGRGIVFNALSVIIGFSVLMLSSFLPVQFFGFLVFVSIGSCLLGALVLLPALTLWLHPRALEPKKP